MQCLSCSKTFATELSVCPSCGKMPTQHKPAASGLLRPMTEKTTVFETTTSLEAAASPEVAAPQVQAAAQTVARTAPPLMPQPMKKEITSTLIEFPKRIKTPEWREVVSERVQAAKERRQLEAEPKKAAKKPTKVKNIETGAAEPLVSPTPPAMVIDLKPNIESPANRLVARALERIERSRQAHQSDIFFEEEIPVLPEPASFKNNFNNSQNGMAKAAAESPTLLFAPNAEKAVAPTRRVLPLVNDLDFKEPASDAVKQKAKTADESIESQEEKTPEQCAVELKSTVVEQKPKKPAVLSITCDADAERILESSIPPVTASSKENRAQPRSVLAQQEVLPRAERRDPAEITEDYAPLYARLPAGAIDFLLCAAIAFAVIAPFAPLEAFEPQNITVRGALCALGIFAVIKFVYLTMGLTLTETTLGLRIFGLRIVHAEDASAPTLIEAAINSLVYLMTLATGGVLLAAILFSPEKRAMHDLLSGTVAVRDN